MYKLTWVALVALTACDQPDELNCEVEVGGVIVCVDSSSQEQCEDDLGGFATVVEIQPGGPYKYCDDVGFPVSCGGTVVEQGEDFTANHPFYAATEEDCAAAEGGTIGG